MSEEIDPESLPGFIMPQNLMHQIYEFTGTSEENKGFLLCFVDQSGTPQIYSQACSPVIEMGLRKTIEDYIDEFNLVIKPDINSEE
tara:strand:+ start:119 stop:376 length:258 start_codon:yes stop_codon:yes gene_type:complete